jgi:hypothetical protein
MGYLVQSGMGRLLHLFQNTPTYTYLNSRKLQASSAVVHFDVMFNDHFTLTKRHLGLLFLVGGIAGFAAILGVDVLDAGREGGIGPAQQIGLALTVALALVGLTLIPLGSAPA